MHALFAPLHTCCENALASDWMHICRNGRSGGGQPEALTALFERFTSRGEADFDDKLLSAMRFEFGGHVEKHVAGM